MNRDELKATAAKGWTRIKESWMDDPLENSIIAACFFAAGWFISALF